MAIPEISFSKDVSIVSTKQVCNVDFSVNENFLQFEARATKNGESYGRGVGTLITSMSIVSPNYFPAGKSFSYVIADTDLVFGEGLYRISMYAQNTDGIWSDAVAFAWDTENAGWDTGIWV